MALTLAPARKKMALRRSEQPRKATVEFETLASHLSHWTALSTAPARVLNVIEIKGLFNVPNGCT